MSIKHNLNYHLKLLNTTIIPKFCNCLYSSEENILIYPISSNLIIFNLTNDTKSIINSKDNNYKISNLKYLDKEKNLILTISKNIFPKINIISINNDNDNGNIFEGNLIYSKIIKIEKNFSISNIFIDRLRYNLFLIILTSIDKNMLYFFHITNIDIHKYDIIPFGKLNNLDQEIIDFKCFYNDNLIICITSNSLIYYKVNLEKQKCIYANQIKFQFRIIPYSLKIDRKNGLISVMSSKGESLIYDKNGNNVSKITCPIKNEYFNFQLFSDLNSKMFMTTNNGNIFIYKIDYYNDTYSFKPKKYINYSFVSQIIDEKCLYNPYDNFNKNINYENKSILGNKNIEIINYNEKDDLILLTLNNGSILLQISFSSLINKNIKQDSHIIYQINHSKNMNNGIIIYNSNPTINKSFDDIIFSSSNDNKLTKHYYDYNSNKFYNYYFDCSYLFKESDIHITSIRFHPKYPDNVLYAGDNKGSLYIIYKDKNYQYQKYYLNKKNLFVDFSIISISFAPDNDYIIYIGFNNGTQRIYDLSRDRNFNYYRELTSVYLTKNEVDFRTKKGHVICFCYFFIYDFNLKKSVLYINNQKSIKISSINNEDFIFNNNAPADGLLINYDNMILDIKMHKSEDYIIVLNNKRQIIINEINYGNIVSKIDLNEIMNYIYNIEIDTSGLYLSLICDFKSTSIKASKSSIAILEINSGRIKNYVKETNILISKTKFDYYGRFLITFGEKGEITIWELDKEIRDQIYNAINEIKKDFYTFWDNYKIKNYTDIDFANNFIINEILEESQDVINKDKNYLDVENYANQEDFFRINNKGDNVIGLKSTNKIIDNNNNNSISVTDSIDKVSDFKKNINKNNITNNYTITNSVNYNKNEENVNPYIEDDSFNYNDNNNNISNDDFMVEDHYINRKSNNYKSSINYLATFRNNNYNNRNSYKKEIKNGNEIEGKLGILTYRKSNGTKKRSMSSNNSKNNIYNRNNSYKANIKSSSLRDIIMNNNKEKDNYKNNNNNDIKKSRNDIHNNNNLYIETPHFHMSQSSPLSSNNNINYNMDNKDIIKNNLNLISSTIPRQVFSNRESYKDYFDLKKKIIVESSTLLHDERRMMNLANALNKKGSKNINISSRVNYNNYNKYIKDEENDKSISNLNEDMIIINNKKLNDDKRILFGNDSRNYNDEFFRGKYPEPEDIDNNLVNIKYTNNLLKNSGNMIKIDKKYERNKFDNSNENLYYINNRNVSDINNSSYYNKSSSSISMIKEAQNNNTNLRKNTSNYLNNYSSSKYNDIKDITNIDNTSIGEQISYLENNIKEFEKNFGK